MRRIRVPRSGGMILGMFLALVATALLPLVFMTALVISAEARPRPLGETLKELGRPVARSIGRVVSRLP